MKFFKSFLFVALTALLFTACQKEYSLEDAGGAAAGTLKEDNFGDCLPSSVNGIYKKDSTLGNQNYIDVQVNVTSIGAYTINTDTVNGYSFKAFGSFNATGLNTVRLLGTGKPLAAGFNIFTVKFGSTNCSVEVSVLAAGASVATYALQGAPGSCSGAIIAGTYKQGVPLNFNNTVSLKVNVTSLGNYTIGTTSVNGMFFQTSGVFTSTGVQTIVLDGQGTPSAAGSFNITAGNASNTCTFSITVTTTASAVAVYTLGGAPNTCTGVVVAGTYQAGLATSSSNTAKFNVTVTTAGTYSLTTTTVNGVIFSGAGTFAATGAQTVTLTASGTPTAAGTFNYPATAGSSTCTFSITFTAAAAPAVYTLGGAPASCTGATVSGTYTAGTAMTSANTVTITANVTTIGSYNITTAAVNGMTFAASGLFTVTGAQNIILVGTGTPVAAGNHSFTPTGGTSSCSFVVTVTGTATNFITCKINGVFTSFNVNAMAILDNTAGFPILSIDGEATTGSIDPSISFGIAKTTGGNITAGTYTVNQFLSGIVVGAYYYDAASTEFIVETDGTTQTPGFTITITSITSSRVIGTFSGRVKENTGAGPGFRDITEGVFNVPF
jgi:hypothetical protein